MAVQRDYSTRPSAAPRTQTKAQMAAAGAAAELESMRELIGEASTKLASTRGTVTQHGTAGRSPAQNAMDLDEALTALVALLDGVSGHLDEFAKLLNDLAN